MIAAASPLPTVPPVRIAFVLHLEPVALATGQVYGEVEDVDTGRVSALRSWPELSAFCVASLAAVPLPRSFPSSTSTPVVSDDDPS